MNIIQKLFVLLSALFAANVSFAAAVAYSESADIATTVTGITTIAATVGAAFIVLALTRMFYRKLRGVTRG